MSSSHPPSRKKWQPPTVEELQPELPQYEISGLLGRGGMGAVYRARQKSLKREVAIKVLPPMLDDADMHFAQRFKAEAQSMARLNHPGIIAVYDAGETPGGLLYFVMEFVEGTDVRQMIAAAGRLPPAHAHAIAACVCDALAYAHASGLIHRDIKPANVMLDTEGRVKVADFGLVKLMDEDGELTLSNMAVGTPDFVAPEALVPGAPVDARADLYAVGVMLYQMLTGNIPRGAWHPASSMVPEVDPRFDEIIVKAMQLNRDARHSSALEMRAHLDTLLMPLVPVLQPSVVQASGLQPGAAETAAPHSPSGKSRTSLFLGIGAAAAISIGAFLMFSGDKDAKQSSPLAPSSGTSVPGVLETAQGTVRTTPPAAKPQTLASLPPPPIKVIEPSRPESKPAMAEFGVKALADSAKPAAPEPKAVVVSTPTAPVKAVSPPLQGSATALQNATAPQAAPSPRLPPELAAMDATFIRNQQERVTAPFEAEVATLNASYLGGIATKIRAEKAAGNLDGIVALEAEHALITDRRSVPDEDDSATPASLKSLRMIYRASHAQIEVTRAANLKKLTDPFRVWLTATEAGLTKKDRVADAKIVRGYRDALDESIPGPQSADATKPAAAINPARDFAIKGGHTNSLGMKFVAVKGTEVMFCIHETRYQDYAVYAAETPGVDVSWKGQSFEGFTPTDRPEKHPVTVISWENAQQFCTWLSRKEGRRYRLPTDREWSTAVGIGREEKWLTDTTPATVFKPPREYPWGDQWPIPKGAGNYCDMSRHAQAPKALRNYFEGYDDGYPTTAPVMSYKPNRFGLYDMGGNVYEWCQDWSDHTQQFRVLRGASFIDDDRSALLSSYRYQKAPNRAGYGWGFRVVLVTAPLSSPPIKPVQTALAPISPPRVLDIKTDHTNSLGMKFVAVKGTDVLFCIHETRYSDYAAYAAAESGVDGDWKGQTSDGYALTENKANHPVMMVSWLDAQRFCEWLSKKEGKTYRLPTDKEWSIAVGIGHDERRRKETTPATVNQVADEFPWGTKWPPPEGSGNYSDQSRKARAPRDNTSYLDGYVDAYPTTAPVMSYKPNKLGIYDLGGNVWEWVEDWYDDAKAARALRGSGFVSSDRGSLLSSTRNHRPPTYRDFDRGFRCVLVVETGR